MNFTTENDRYPTCLVCGKPDAIEPDDHHCYSCGARVWFCEDCGEWRELSEDERYPDELCNECHKQRRAEIRDMEQTYASLYWER